MFGKQKTCVSQTRPAESLSGRGEVRGSLRSSSEAGRRPSAQRGVPRLCPSRCVWRRPGPGHTGPREMHKCECHGPSGFGNETRSGGRLVTPSPPKVWRTSRGHRRRQLGRRALLRTADGGLTRGQGRKLLQRNGSRAPPSRPPRAEPAALLPSGRGGRVCLLLSAAPV